jgi:hypothetical protein
MKKRIIGMAASAVLMAGVGAGIVVAGAGPAAAADTSATSSQDDCSWEPWDWDDCMNPL